MSNNKLNIHKNFKRIISFITAMTLIVAVFCCPLSGSATSKGIDISGNNGMVDFGKLKTQTSFVYMKASEGTGYHDVMFNRNAQNATETKILWGAYHFFRIKNVTYAKQQADYFWNIIKGYKFTMIPVVDIELPEGKTANEIQKELKAFLNRFKDDSGYYPIIYTYRSFIWEYLGGGFSTKTLWVSDLSTKHYGSLLGWKSADLWQFSWSGHLTSIDKGINPVDLDIAYNNHYLMSYLNIKTKQTVKNLWDKDTYLISKNKISVPFNANAKCKLYTYTKDNKKSTHFITTGQSIRIVNITSNHKLFEVYFAYDNDSTKLVHSYLPVSDLYKSINLWNHNTWYTYKTIKTYSLDGKKVTGLIGKNTMADVIFSFKCGDKVIGRFNIKHIYSLFRIKK